MNCFFSVVFFFLIGFSSANHLIIKYSNSTNFGVVQINVGTNKAHSAYSTEYTNLAALGVEILQVDDTVTCASYILDNPTVIECSESFNITIDDDTQSHPLPNDPLLAQQWGLSAVNVEQVWQTGLLGNRAIIVCVVDTGIDITHPDLQANIWNNTKEIPNNGIDDDGDGVIDDIHGASFLELTASNDPTDLNGHGTSVAGIIGAVQNNGIGISGVAPVITLLPCRYMNADGSGNVIDALSCINYCLTNKASVINMSWGFRPVYPCLTPLWPHSVLRVFMQFVQLAMLAPTRISHSTSPLTTVKTILM